MDNGLYAYMLAYFTVTFIGYIFIFELTKIRIYLKNIKLKYIFYLILILLFIINIFIFINITWIDEFGGVARYSPDTFEDFAVLLFMFFLFQESKGKRVFYLSLGYTLVKSADILYSFFNNIVFQYMINLVNEAWLSYALMLLYPFIYLLFYILIRKFLNHMVLEDKEWWIFSVMSLILLSYCYFVIDFMPNVDPENLFLSTSVDYILIIFIIGIFFVFFYYLRMLNRQKKALLDMKLHEQAELYRSELAARIETAIIENKKLKHDLKNHFIMLESIIKVDDEMALEYLHDIMGRMEIIDIISTSNMHLNYLVNSKAEKMKSLNIDLKCDFKYTLDFLNLFELTTILGNLLDNAIEAQKYVESKKFIKISAMKKIGKVRLIIENSCNIEKIHMENQNLITNKVDKENHGIGYKRVCEIVKEKSGIITRTVNQGIFTVEIILPIDM